MTNKERQALRDTASNSRKGANVSDKTRRRARRAAKKDPIGTALQNNYDFTLNSIANRPAVALLPAPTIGITPISKQDMVNNLNLYLDKITASQDGAAPIVLNEVVVTPLTYNRPRNTNTLYLTKTFKASSEDLLQRRMRNFVNTYLLYNPSDVPEFINDPMFDYKQYVTWLSKTKALDKIGSLFNDYDELIPTLDPLLRYVGSNLDRSTLYAVSPNGRIYTNTSATPLVEKIEPTLITSRKKGGSLDFFIKAPKNRFGSKIKNANKVTIFESPGMLDRIMLLK